MNWNLDLKKSIVKMQNWETTFGLLRLAVFSVKCFIWNTIKGASRNKDDIEVVT